LIIVPSLLSQLNANHADSYKRQEVLSVLNRLGTLVWEAGGLPVLISMMEEGHVDR